MALTIPAIRNGEDGEAVMNFINLIPHLPLLTQDLQEVYRLNLKPGQYGQMSVINTVLIFPINSARLSEETLQSSLAIMLLSGAGEKISKTTLPHGSTGAQ